mgnify:CR=1 FL=1
MKCKVCGNTNPKKFLKLQLPKGLKPYALIFDGKKTRYKYYDVYVCLRCHEAVFIEVNNDQIYG